MKKVFLCVLLFCGILTGVQAFQVDPAKAQIVVPADAEGIVKFSAQEL